VTICRRTGDAVRATRGPGTTISRRNQNAGPCWARSGDCGRVLSGGPRCGARSYRVRALETRALQRARTTHDPPTRTKQQRREGVRIDRSSPALRSLPAHSAGHVARRHVARHPFCFWNVAVVDLLGGCAPWLCRSVFVVLRARQGRVHPRCCRGGESLRALRGSSAARAVATLTLPPMPCRAAARLLDDCAGVLRMLGGGVSAVHLR